MKRTALALLLLWPGYSLAATCTWTNGNITGVWNDSGNWSCASVPGSGDDVVLDGTSTDNLTVDVAVSINSFSVTSGYTGAFDAATYSVGVGNVVIEQTSGSFDWGSGTWTVSGDFDLDSFTATAVTADGTAVLTGTTKSMTGRSSLNYPDLVQISGSYELTNVVNRAFVHNITITSTGYLLLSREFAVNKVGGATLTIDSGGELEIGAVNTFIGYNAGGTYGLINNGTITDSTGGGRTTLARASIDLKGNIPLYLNITRGLSIANVTLSGDTSVETLKLDDGGGVLNVDLSNFDLTINGDLVYVNVDTWTKGTGTITLSGAANQSIDFGGKTVEDIVIDKTDGTVTLTGNVTTDSLTLTDGALDIDGNTLTVSGNMTVAAGTSVDDSTPASGAFAITGNIDINGTSGSGVTWTDADIDSLGAGTNDADYTTVTDSTNSSGNAIDCTTSCTDGGGNTGWTFSGGGVTVPTNALINISGRWEEQSGSPTEWFIFNSGRWEEGATSPGISIQSDGRLEEQASP